jgi:hypothetical protein
VKCSREMRMMTAYILSTAETQRQQKIRRSTTKRKFGLDQAVLSHADDFISSCPSGSSQRRKQVFGLVRRWQKENIAALKSVSCLSRRNPGRTLSVFNLNTLLEMCRCIVTGKWNLESLE